MKYYNLHINYYNKNIINNNLNLIIESKYKDKILK